MSLKHLLLAGAAFGLVLLPACNGQDETPPETGNSAPEATGNDQGEAAEAPRLLADYDFTFVQEVSDIEADDRVVYGTLDNGMRYAIKENDTPPGTASIRMRFDVGSVYEADDQQGLAHFLEHMAFNGSEGVPEGEMIPMLERYGLAFGPDTNAYTSFDETVYQLDLPSVEEDVIDTGLFLMRETASNLLIEQSAIDAERGVVLSEERVRNTYGLRRFRDLFDFIIPDTPFAERFPIGTVEVIETAQRDRFVDLYERYYVPERTTLVVVGDFDASDMEARIRERFADWEPAAEPGEEPDLGEIQADRGLQAGFFHDPDVPTFITIGVVEPYAPELDTVAKRRRDTIAALGNAILSRRFAKIERQPDSPIIGGSASLDTYFNIARGPSIDLTAQPDTWQAALALGEQELRRAIEYGFSEAELAEQVANFRKNLKNAVDQANTRENARLATQIVGAIGGDQVFSTPQAALARFEALAEGLTPEDIHRVFVESWEGREPLIHLSNNEEIEDAEAKIIDVWKASKDTAVEAPEFAESLDFAYTDFGTPGEIASDTRVEDLDVREIIFDNNVRLSLKKTDFEEGVIRVNIDVGGGALEFPADVDGLGLMMNTFFAQAGLEAHSYDELETLTAGRSVNLGLGVGAEGFGGNYSTTPDDLELQMQVAAAYLTAPGYREEANSQAQALLKVFYPTLDSQPGGIVQRDVQRIIAGGDVRFGIGPLEELLERDISQLKPVLERAQREGAIAISIVGDIDEQAAIDAVAKTFGALPERLGEPLEFADRRNVSFPETGRTITLTHEGEENQAEARIYWPAVDASDIRTARVANMLRAVLRLKLIEVLREETGATYSPGAGVSTSNVYPGYGYLLATSAVEPDNIPVVFETVDRIVAEMGDGAVSEDDMERARKPILEDLENDLEENGVWLGVISDAVYDKAAYDEFRQKIEMYESITAEEVVEMAKTYLTPDNALRFAIVHSSLAEE